MPDGTQRPPDAEGSGGNGHTGEAGDQARHTDGGSSHVGDRDTQPHAQTRPERGPDLSDAQREAAVRASFLSGYGPILEQFEEGGISPEEFFSAYKAQSGISQPDEAATAFYSKLNQSPDLQELFQKRTAELQEQNARAEEALRQAANPEQTSGAPDEPNEPGAPDQPDEQETPYDETEDRRLQDEAIRAYQESVSDPTDDTKRQEAARAMEESQAYHNAHNHEMADKLDANKLKYLKYFANACGFGILLFIGALYAGASAAEAVGKGSK